MTRLAATIDRIAALVCGLALVALGLGLVLWNTRLIPRTPELITAPGLVAATGTRWWPWAVAAVGVVLVVVALRWLIAHTPKARAKDLRLLANDAGTVSADLGQLADAAARALAESPDVHSAKGRAVVDRGVTTIDLTVTAYSPQTVTAAIAAIDHVQSQLATALGAATVAVRTSVHVDGRTRRDRVA